MKKLKIVIEVRGGVVQQVYTNQACPMEYYLLDHDNIDCGEDCEIPPSVLAECDVNLDD